MTDTIFARATAGGPGGVAILRLSGPKAGEVILKMTGGPAPSPRTAEIRKISTEGGLPIDRGLVLFFKGPASFTGEDVTEFHVHGGPAVMDALQKALTGMTGLRLAEPGEFTRRAFENGKMDLTAAEAVADLVSAETEAQRVQALSQMEGGLARVYENWRDRLTRILAYVEADIDFPDEDIPAGLGSEALTQTLALAMELEAHLNDARRGEILRSGVQVVVIGAPNAGKSSLVNALAQREVAIVSPMAGTTRDILEAPLNLGGFPVILSDTAGLRPGQLGVQEHGGHDAIESEGIRRALARARAADLKILLFDSSSLPGMDGETCALVDEKSLVVFSKSDLGRTEKPPPEFAGAFFVSTKTGEGLDFLARALVEKISARLGMRETPPPTRQRHRAALEDCAAALTRARAAALAELAAEDLRLAIRSLGRITGRVDVEDLLDVIFRDFCIGK